MLVIAQIYFIKIKLCNKIRLEKKINSMQDVYWYLSSHVEVACYDMQCTNFLQIIEISICYAGTTLLRYKLTIL